MRRPQGNGLVENELRVLAVAVRLHQEKRRWTTAELLDELLRLDKQKQTINEATAYRIVTRFCLDHEYLNYSWRLPTSYHGRPSRQFHLNPIGLKAAKAALNQAFAEGNAPWAKVTR
ncbi:MAG TPA: hypothetical protein DEG43_12020 [Acidimicrobiaceae bacterium]|jgi:hypothetical protein|nr:hypothetical protein [Acidimicrobiaceae bacterium]